MVAAKQTPTPLPLSIELPVLGLPVRFATNDLVVLDAVEEAFGAWRGIEPDASATTPFEVRITTEATAGRVGAGGASGTTGAGSVHARPHVERIRHILPDASRLVVYSAHVIGCSEPRRRMASAHAARSVLQDRDRFREEVVEALTLGLLTRFDRQPFHAAALVRGGVALLLAGPSGAGKSTLALAAARAGIAVLSEDIVFLQSSPRMRVWGMAQTLRLLPGSVPGLAPQSAVTRARRPGDPPKLHLPLARLDAPAGPRVADRCVLCVLGERRATATLRRIDAAEAVAALDLHARGFDIFAATIRPALDRMTARGAWLLHPEPVAAASLPLLERILDDAGHAAAPHPKLQPGES